MEQTPIMEQMAIEEIISWLDYKKVDASERTENQKFIDKLVTSIQNGSLSIEPTTQVITHTLKFPVTDSVGNVLHTSLKYPPRAKIGQLVSKTGNLKGVGMDMYNAYGSALSNIPLIDIKNIDSEDFKIMQAVVTFFL